MAGLALALGVSLSMACILLVDPSEVAQRAMKGILARGGHRLAIVANAPDAWRFVRTHVRVDLVFTELKLEGEAGLELVQRIKADCFTKLLPVVVYTEHGNREAVKRGLDLRVQNFLIKPYHDAAIFGEIAKAAANPWNVRHFEEERSFCKLVGLTADGLHKMLDALRVTLLAARTGLTELAKARSAARVNETLGALAEDAETAGAWGVVDCVNQLREKAEAGAWPEFDELLEGLDFAAALIFRHLNPGLLPEPFLAVHELNAEREAREQAVWFSAPAEQRCPVTTLPDLQRELDAITGVPVIDSVAAAFEMGANGHPSCLSPLMDIVDRDPALAAQLLIAANAARRTEDQDANPIEDPRLSVSLLGEKRLADLARMLVTVEERLMHVPPAFNWPQFWTFQVGVARMARYTARYLDLHVLEAPAYTAGLLHDLGKLLLLRLHPFGLQAVFDHARRAKIPVREAEKYFLGCTTAEMAVHFATQQRLPPRFIHVMEWWATPELATADADLVAVVSFARALCLHNRVGNSGDSPAERLLPIEETPEWRVLRGSVFPSFNLREFELKAHQHCHELRLELHGRLKEYAAA